ncbi:MAG: magnesium transporter [Chloroflexi bacterium]|nr:magnesium transporter [Chloroflexota bacterium]
MKNKRQKPIEYAEDVTESPQTLLRLRLPSLLIGLGLGIVISFLTSQFEEVLARNVAVAFFLPFIVYMADAIGTQTQSIYTRALKTGEARFQIYLIKESVVGLMLGVVLGIASGLVALWWLRDNLLAVSVGVSMFSTAASAPLVALLITQASQRLREDPAVGAGPIATVIQDMISVIIYGAVSSIVLL